MPNFANRNYISFNCNLENDFQDLSFSLLSHSKLDYKLNKLLQELKDIFTLDSDSIVLRCENLLLKFHQILDRKSSNCDKIYDSIEKNFNSDNVIWKKKTKHVGTLSTSSCANEGNVEKAKIVNSVSLERKGNMTKRDKSRRSLRIITQSKSISKFKRSSLSRYHHLDHLNSLTRPNNLLHCNPKRRRCNVVDNSNTKKTNSENVYCFCKKGAFGKMIACDNKGCKIEWFHNKCVNVIDVPNGEWFCPDCRNLML